MLLPWIRDVDVSEKYRLRRALFRCVTCPH